MTQPENVTDAKLDDHARWHEEWFAKWGVGGTASIDWDDPADESHLQHHVDVAAFHSLPTGEVFEGGEGHFDGDAGHQVVAALYNADPGGGDPDPEGWEEEPLPALPTTTTTVYLATDGDDGNNGSTEQQAVASFQRAFNLANATGQATLVSIAPGVYRGTLVMTSGSNLIVFHAPNGATLSGAETINTGWTAIGGNRFERDWPYSLPTKTPPGTWPQDRKDTINNSNLHRMECLWVDDDWYFGELSTGDLGPGRFFIDTANDKIVVEKKAEHNVFDGAHGHQIETGVHFVTADGINMTVRWDRANVHFRGVTFEKSPGSVDDIHTRATGATNHTLEACTFRLAAWQGFASRESTGGAVRQCDFIDNGVSSFAHWRSREIYLADILAQGNNIRGFDAGWTGWASGHKWMSTRHLTMRRAKFLDNLCAGFWCDSDNQNVDVDYLCCARNWNHGIFIELNTGPILLDHVISYDNEFGVVDARSNHVTIRNADIFDNRFAQFLFVGLASGLQQTLWDGEWNDEPSGSIHVRTENWHLENLRVRGSGTSTAGPGTTPHPLAGWLFYSNDYAAGGDDGTYHWLTTTMFIDNNQWWHADKNAGLRFGAHETFANWKNRVNVDDSNPNYPNNEANSVENATFDPPLEDSRLF